MFVIHLPEHVAEQLGDNPEQAMITAIAMWHRSRQLEAEFSRIANVQAVKNLSESDAKTLAENLFELVGYKRAQLDAAYRVVDELQQEKLEAFPFPLSCEEALFQDGIPTFPVGSEPLPKGWVGLG
jgi:hypothetical protein